MSVHFEIDTIVAPPAVEYRTIDQLRPSPYNVRKHQGDATDTADLEASIPAVGLKLPLLVHPMDDGHGGEGVHAGARRNLAIARLIERGELPADFPIPVFVSRDRTPAELIEESIVENRDRKDLRSYEIYAGVAEAHRLGEDVAKLAAGIGESADWVRQAIRLGNLAPAIFQAFADDRITIDQARAYGATEDHALQLAAFADLDPLDEWKKSPAKIRAQLRFGDPELGRLLQFVGEGAYRDAGGRYELDLFAEDASARGRVADEPLLRALADAEFASLRDQVRVNCQRRDLRFVAQPPRNEFGTDYALRVTPQLIDSKAGRIELPAGEIVGFITVGDNGTPEVSYWWESRAAKFGREPARRDTPAPRKVGAGAAIGQQYDGSRQAADAEIRDGAGLTADGVQIFRSLRQAILRALLIEDARVNDNVGLDYLVWSQLRAALGDSYRQGLTGARAIPGESAIGVGDGLSKARQHVDASEAGRAWGAAIAELNARPFMTLKHLGEAFRAYRAEPWELKNLGAAVVAGLSLERSLNADGYQVAPHDAIAAELDVTDADIRRWWTPTAELLDLLPKAERLAIVEPMVEAVTFAPWSRLKSADVTRRVLETVKGAGDSVRKSMRDAAKSWVHPLLRFGTGQGAGQ